MRYVIVYMITSERDSPDDVACVLMTAPASSFSEKLSPALPAPPTLLDCSNVFTPSQLKLYTKLENK